MTKQKPNDKLDPDRLARQKMDAIPHKILVMSGKGGVGKTTVAVNIAYALAERALGVGLLDVDIHGPNVALMTGLEGQRTGFDDEHGLIPVESRPGVKVLSISFFLPDSGVPVAWRGPRKSGAIRQLMADGDWSGTDALVVDCPPGTGDEPMSVAQLVGRTDGVIVVTTPQEVSLLDSRKCVRFVSDMTLPVLGIVENMSGLVCPSCGERVELFSAGGGERAARELGVPFLGRVPLSAAMVESGDSGVPLVVAHPEDPAAQALRQVADRLVEAWDPERTDDASDKQNVS
jgi:Mrp family chromosome partitioning ATPase